MKSKALLIALSMSVIALAGCTSNVDEDPGSTLDGSTPDLSEVDLGRNGAIEGLVVDDNYRPLQLKQDWGSSQPGDYQDVGFVLIIETGQRYETTENGEFHVFPLEPGTYTLRIAADAHEAKEYKVNVVKGEWSEATLEARRQYSGGGTVLSQEYVVFVSCAWSAGYASQSAVSGCGDISGDEARGYFYTDYTAIESDVRGMVTEMYAHEDGYYGAAVRTHHDKCQGEWDSLNGCVYAENDVEQGRYAKNVLYPGMQREGVEEFEYIEDGQEGYCTYEDLDSGETAECGRYWAFQLDYEFQTILFPTAANQYYTDQAYDPYSQNPTCQDGSDAGTPCFNRPSGAGPVFGIKAQFLQTVFLYDLPEQGIDQFCQLCEDAELPE